MNGTEYSALQLKSRDRGSIASERVYNNDYENDSQKNVFSSFGISFASNDLANQLQLSRAQNSVEPNYTMPSAVKPITERKYFSRGFTERFKPDQLTAFKPKQKEEFDLTSNKRLGYASTAQGVRTVRR